MSQRTVVVVTPAFGLRAVSSHADNLHGQRASGANRSCKVKPPAAPVDNSLKLRARDTEGESRLGKDKIEGFLAVVANHGRIVEKTSISPFAGEIIALHVAPPSRAGCFPEQLEEQ